MRVLGLVVLAAACAGPNDDSSEPATPCDAVDVADCMYPGADHAVSSVQGYTVHDETTGRDLPILVRYPTDGPGPFPVVIWSHGGSFSDHGETSYGAWGTVLAQQGYVVVHPAHVHPNALQIAKLCDLAGIPGDECFGPSGTGEDDDNSVYLVARPYDVIAVMDEVTDIGTWLQAQGGPSIDAETIGLCGHSGGSIAPLTLAGAVKELSPSVPRWSLTDDRPKATFGLSPQGPGFSGYFDDGTETSMDDVTGPVLIMTGSDDIKPDRQDLLPSIRRQTWENLPGGHDDQYLLYSLLPPGEGNHGTYGLDDRDSSDENLVRLTGALTSTARAWLDLRLKGSDDAAAWLASDAPQRLAGDAEWLVK